MSLIFLLEDKEKDEPSAAIVELSTSKSTPATTATTAPSSIASHNSENSQPQGSPQVETKDPMCIFILYVYQRPLIKILMHLVTFSFKSNVIMSYPFAVPF
jgi:hypothetical protein